MNLIDDTDVNYKKKNNNTKKIMAIEYHYDLEKIFSITDNLSLKEKYSLYEVLINDYLKKIKLLENYPSMNDISKDINDITEFYDYTYGVDDQKEESTLYEAMEEADDIVDDLYLKLFDLLQQTDFFDDGIHPNEKGHEKIYKAIKKKGEKYE